MRFSSVIIGLLSSISVVSGVPVEENLAVRQLGGGPNEAVPGTTWYGSWKDTKIKAPTKFQAVRGSGCSFTVSFKRDVTDTKYKLAFYPLYGYGEARSREFRSPTNLQWTGPTVDGKRTYSVFVEDACNTFLNSKPPPSSFKIYFTESNQSKTNYNTNSPVV